MNKSEFETVDYTDNEVLRLREALRKVYASNWTKAAGELLNDNQRIVFYDSWVDAYGVYKSAAILGVPYSTPSAASYARVTNDSAWNKYQKSAENSFFKAFNT